MSFRKQVERLEFRRALWLHVMGLLKIVHHHRLPGRRFGPDLELLVVYGAAMVVAFPRESSLGRPTSLGILGCRGKP